MFRAPDSTQLNSTSSEKMFRTSLLAKKLSDFQFVFQMSWVELSWVGRSELAVILTTCTWTSALRGNGSFCDSMLFINGEIWLEIAGTTTAYLVSYQARTSFCCRYCYRPYVIRCVLVARRLVMWAYIVLREVHAIACICLTVSNAVMFLNDELRAMYAHSALDPRFV